MRGAAAERRSSYADAVAYDERLAGRVRDELADAPDLAEIKMFGGLCFTIRRNMCVGIVNDDLMVRFDASQHDALLAEPGAREMDFTSRPMKGFLFVGADATKTAAQLRRWVRRARAYVEPMPPKKKRARTR